MPEFMITEQQALTRGLTDQQKMLFISLTIQSKKTGG
jgi:hypothetical protein